jgi:hypothetical protein
VAPKKNVYDRRNFLIALKQDRVFLVNFICILFCNTISSFITDLFGFMIANL